METKAKKSIDEALVAIADKSYEEGGEAMGKIDTILALFHAGYTRKEIVDAGFNRTTVYRQVGEYLKLKKAPALDFRGYSLYEARVRRLSEAKNITRDEAEMIIMEKDIEAMDSPVELEMEEDSEEETE